MVSTASQQFVQFVSLISVSFSLSQNQNSKLNNAAINSSSYKEQIQRSSKEEMHFIKQRNDAYMTKFIVAQQQQQKHQQRMPVEVNHHNPLARTVSTPMPIPDANQAVSNLFSSLNDILNAGATVTGTGHRKLERTQSEPLPQTNTSRWDHREPQTTDYVTNRTILLPQLQDGVVPPVRGSWRMQIRW